MAKLGTQEMTDLVSSDYFKPEEGTVYKIFVFDEDYNSEEKEMMINGEKQLRTKFPLKVKVDGENKELELSVSKRVMDIINKYFKETQEFTVIRTEKNYNVVPNGIKK